AESLDLLLGTQGWRRFIRGNYSKSELAFREQLVRLFELDGDPNVTAASYTESGIEYRRQMENYRTRIAEAWARLLEETRYLLLFVLCVWLISIAVYIRRNARLSAAAVVWLAVTSLAVVGCSGSVNSYVASSEQATSEADVDTEDASGTAGPAASFSDAQIPTESEEDSDAGSAISSLVDIFNNIGAGSPGRSGDALNETPNLIGNRSARLSNADRKTVIEMLGGGRSSISPDDLQQLLRSRGLDAQMLADEILRELRFPVRQYAHQYQASTTDDRTDFTETLYWQPLLITDSEGRATIRFDLSDSVSSFRVRVDGHSADGRIGSGLGKVVSRLPFQIEPKLPLEVTAGDVIELPIAVVNTTEESSEVSLALSSDPVLQLPEDTVPMLTVPANGRVRSYLPMTVLPGFGSRDATLRVRGTSSGNHSDGIQRTLRIAPSGFPIAQSLAGRLSGQAVIDLPIPSGLIQDSLSVSVRAYPSPLADVMSGVASILREPHGCFEQTSATNYPNTMALQYLRESQTANPDVSRKALGMLDRGYGKLTAFECEKLGFEWFGDDPGHEALSAFGLMQFTDMAKVMNVSAEMMERTRTWLMGRRDGNGGFQRNPRHLHVWSVKQPIVNAYVLWAISEADVSAGNPQRAATELSPELDKMVELAQQSVDPYLIALSAATLMNVQRTDEGESLLKRLAEFQKPDGSLQGKTTVTSSGGISLTMETTALAALAWTKSPQHISEARSAIGWIQSHRINGGFGSTQATVLALKALVAFTKHTQTSSGSELEIRLNGTAIGQARMPYQPQGGSTVEISGLGTAIEAAASAEGSVKLELISRGSKDLSFSIDLSCHVDTPNSHPECPVHIDTQWSAASSELTSTRDGELLKVIAEVRNLSVEGQPMTVAAVGLPGGVEPRTEQLDELKTAGEFDYYEIRGRDVVFYWRMLEPKAIKKVEFHVTATVPGTYTGPASRTYLYYTAEQKHWTEPLEIKIAP
ncbi:MAG: alpha-2-macroglobulin family protein, partial [Planctomycetota bacterium]